MKSRMLQNVSSRITLNIRLMASPPHFLLVLAMTLGWGDLTRVAFPAPSSDNDEACGNQLSRSEIGREVVENPCSVFLVDSHAVADHLLDGAVPTLAGQSSRGDDHAQVVTGLARAGHEVSIGPGR